MSKNSERCGLRGLLPAVGFVDEKETVRSGGKEGSHELGVFPCDFLRFSYIAVFSKLFFWVLLGFSDGSLVTVVVFKGFSSDSGWCQFIPICLKPTPVGKGNLPVD